jgi:SAM-dependent methyltransferase
VSGAAETYTHGHHESVLRSHRWRTAANSAAYLLPHLRAGQDLLDVGCGPGTITIDLARIVAPGRVAGVDRAEAPLATARADAATAGVAIDFDVGDAYALAFPDDSFDVVHAHQLLQHLARPVAALAEMRRVCRRDGIVAARDSDYAAMTWFPGDPLLDRWLSIYREVARANGGEPDAGRRLLAWGRAAGFAEVVPSASVWCFATAADRAWWGGLWADRVTASAFAEGAIERGVSDAAELGRIADAWRAWAAEPDGWFSVLHGEVVCRG